ncbi:MAG: sn-glycerol-3-phosphate import ATP-binding protein UgpC [Mesorhizobium sp.]
MATVDLKDVRKVYPGGVEAVKGVSIAIPDKALCVLVGPSGCGKSTLLRMIAGLETITAGDCVFEGRVMNEIGPAERDIAMVFQNYALYPHMSVYDNMAYGLRNRGTPKAEIDQRVKEAARILAIEPYLDRKPRQLSGGQRQRVAMGRAIVRKPQVFLFDEPLSNLDAKLRGQMRIEIKKLQSALGVTSVYVTHDQVEAMTLADLLVVMNEGRAEQIDTPTAIYDKPASVFVAGFIGSPAMNLILTTTLGSKGLELPGGVVVKPRDASLPEGGRHVLLGIRPEHLTSVEQLNADFTIDISVVEALGADTLVHGRIVGATDSSADIIARLPGNTSCRTGERLHLAIQPGAIHLFDAASGTRI